MSPLDYELAHERQELASRQTRERIARLHLWLQGGPIPPTDEDRLWVMEWFPDLNSLVRLRDETGSIPPSSEYHLERARRFIAGDLDALCDITPPENGSTPHQYDGFDAGENDPCIICGHPRPEHYAWSTECARIDGSEGA